jgi:hypothetical protein
MQRPAHHHLEPVALKRLRPTQFTVGLGEVADKRAEWAALKAKDRRELLASHWFPAVRGPDGRHHIVDHHHLGLALWGEGVTEVQVTLLDDLSYLDVPTFHAVMEHRQWLHPFDAQGRRRPPGALPKRLDGLVDDPYRSLAGRVRVAGGCAKDNEPFAEFLWADYFRRRVPRKLLTSVRASDREDVLREAIALAHSPQARYLPGWSGDASRAA